MTHIALGACMGEAFAGKTVGKKAMLWGILAQSIPDIDFLAALWLPVQDNLLAHRGFTHSILFALLLSPIIAGMAYRLHRPHNINFGRWLLFITAAMLGHIFLDAFNNYGVAWFEPFSHLRISFNSVYVADPFFSVVPGMAVLLLIILRKKNKLRKKIWKAGLVLPMLYLLYGLANKWYVTYETKKILATKQVSYKRILSTPAPLQSWLWFIAIEKDSGFYTTYRSVFDDKKRLKLFYFAKQHNLESEVKNKPELYKLIRFSQGYYTLEKRVDTLVLNDLRFGQVTGWQRPTHGFAFYYYLQPPADNLLVVQRGRFANWNEYTFNSLLRRIQGE